MTKKEDNLKLAIKLRNDRFMTILGAPFKASNNEEISDLIGCRVFKFKQYNSMLHSTICIFKLRLVREVKGRTTKLKRILLLNSSNYRTAQTTGQLKNY
jgi:hypothetical protein